MGKYANLLIFNALCPPKTRKNVLKPIEKHIKHALPVDRFGSMLAKSTWPEKVIEKKNTYDLFRKQRAWAKPVMGILENTGK